MRWLIFLIDNQHLLPVEETPRIEKVSSCDLPNVQMYKCCSIECDVEYAYVYLGHLHFLNCQTPRIALL